MPHRRKLFNLPTDITDCSNLTENNRTLSVSTDKQLLKAFTTHRDETAFTELVARHSAMVRRVCWRILGNEHDVDDCLQAVFMLLARRARLIAWQASIANWLYGAAWRIAKREWRRRLKAPSQEYEMIQHPHSAQPGVESDRENVLELIENRLYPAIYALPSRYRGPIVLCYLEGKSRQQASHELGIRESVLKGRLERGKQVLRKKIATGDDALVARLSSGALAVSISQRTLPFEEIRQISQNAISYALGSATVNITTTSIVLYKGESLAMFLGAQLKLALALVGTVGLVAGVCYFATAPSTVASSAEPSLIAVANNENDKDLATQRHLRAIAQAIHVYVDAHEGKLPPAMIPNPDLPAEKRLSGLVAILPYLGVKPSYLEANDAQWQAWHADNARAKSIYAKIDLSKAWDNPVNAEAARTIVPEFLCPMEAPTTNADGIALTHFAFVRGGKSRDNGMFPLTGKTDLAISDINDGTTATASVGQVHDKPGPWIAAGQSTARFLNSPKDKSNLSFGSPEPGLVYMANGDATVYCLDLTATPDKVLYQLSGRDDQTMLNMRNVPHYSSFSDALKQRK